MLLKQESGFLSLACASIGGSTGSSNICGFSATAFTYTGSFMGCSFLLQSLDSSFKTVTSGRNSKITTQALPTYSILLNLRLFCMRIKIMRNPARQVKYRGSC